MELNDVGTIKNDRYLHVYNYESDSFCFNNF